MVVEGIAPEVVNAMECIPDLRVMTDKQGQDPGLLVGRSRVDGEIYERRVQRRIQLTGLSNRMLEVPRIRLSKR